MILPLLKYNIKNNRFIFIAIVAVLTMYLSIIISMYDPANVKALETMLEIFPQELINALGFSNFGTTLLSFISGYIYGFLILIFPIILVIVSNHKMVASLVDKGSMAYLLSSSNSRYKVIFTQALTSILIIVVFFILITIIGIASCELMFPGDLDISMFIKLNAYVFILYFATSSIVFFGSSIATESKYSLAIGVSFPISFLLIQMIANVGDKFEWLENLTLYTLFNPQRLIEGDTNFIFMAIGILSAIAIIFYSASIITFNKRNLYL